MGKRAERRERRLLRELILNTEKESNEYVPFLTDKIYEFCSNCEHHREVPISGTLSTVSKKSICLMKARNHFTVTQSALNGSIVSVRGRHEVKKKCEMLPILLLEDDLDR